MPPTSLIESLHAVRRKVRVLAITSGVGITLASGVALLVAIVLVDWSLGLEKLPRLIVMLAALFGLGYVFWHWLVGPATATLNIGDVAGRLEHTYPQFDDRLRSTVNFTQGEIPGSEMMKQLVVKEANSLATQVNLGRVIVRRPVYYSTLAAIASVALLIFLIAWGNRSGWLRIATDRLLMGDEQWPKSVEIALDGALPQRVAVGQRVPVKLHLTKGDKESRKSIIYYRYDNGPWTSEIMTRKDGAYTAMLDARLEQGHKDARLEVRVESGDDKLLLNPVAVVQRLEIARVAADVTPPPYVAHAITSTINLTEHPAIMAVGSKVGLRIDFNKILKDDVAVELHPMKEGQKAPAVTWDRSTAGVAIARFDASTSFRFTVKATDSDGFQNAGGEEYELMVKEDQPPTVQIEEPKRSEDRTPNAGFDIKAVAEDDYGIVGGRLVVDRINVREKSADPSQKPADAAQKPAPAGPSVNHWVVDLVKDSAVVDEHASWEPADSSPERKRYHLGYHWELESLAKANLKPGDVLEYYVQVKDNFSLNGKEHAWVPSGKLRITIVSLEQYLNEKQAQAEQIQAQIKAEHMSELRQKAETETLKTGLERNKKFDEADKTQANRLANDQANTQSQTMQLADRLQNMVREMTENKAPEAGLKETAKQVEKELRQAAETPMREAKKNLDAAKDAPPPDPNAKVSPPDANEKTSPQDPVSKKSPQDRDARNNPQDSNAKNDPKDSGAKNDPKDGGAKSDPKDASAKNDPKDGGAKSDPKDASAKNDPKDGGAKSDPKDASAKNDPKDAGAKSDPKDASAKNDPKDGGAKGDPKDSTAKNDAKDGGAKSDPKDASAQGNPKDGGAKSDPKDASAQGSPKDGGAKSDPKSASAKNNPKKDEKQKAVQLADARQRSGEMEKAADNQQKAADELQKAMDKLGEMGGLPEAIARMEQMKADQKKLEEKFRQDNKNNIGKNDKELSKEDQEKNKKAAEEQSDLAKQMEQALDKMDKKGDKMSKSDPSSSQAMKDAAQMGKSQGLPSKQKQAADDMQQNHQDKAQNGQRQVELGIDLIINKLREAQRKQLEELARQLAQIQQLLAELIQRQAGHNIDNLVIQKIFDKVDSKEREELLTIAGRDPKNLPPAIQLSQLTPSQEQTQRNTVDIAKQAEALPDPAPAAKLTQAAGHMERAIVHLRDAKPADAYKPPQVDALATLLDAKKDVDAAMKKVNDQIQADDAETIKQMYITLLEDQKKIGADLVKIDKAAKANNGDLPREQSVRLGQLPTDQGKLIERTDKLGEKLRQLDSVVYDWANKDILKAMGLVKDNLAKPDTGKPTQVAEAHTEKQLQDMIDSLIQKVKDKRFDERGGGGGGGGQGQPKPKLPSEAELRLLKKNQEGIREATVDADKQKVKDKEELTDLSARQNDLRNLLDTLVQKATQGQQKLGPPPDPKDELPEEAPKEAIDDKELQDDLLGGKVTDKTVDKGLQLTGTRMSRSGWRLGRIDPGPVTQEIQKRIVLDIDDLIKMAQAQQGQSKPKPGSGQGQKMAQPKPQPQQGPQQAAKPGAPKQGGNTAAQKSQLAQGGPPNVDPNGNVKEAMNEWGNITKRDRQAVQESASDDVVQKYQKLVEDYYRSLAEQASKR